MADLKTEIEDRLIVNKSMLQLFEADRLLSDRERKYISTRSERLKSDLAYDVHNYTVNYISNEPIEKHIHVRAIIDSTLSMEGGDLRKVIYNGTTFSERGGIYTAEVKFIMVHSFEKGISIVPSRY